MKLWMTGKATPQKRTTWERIGQAKEAIIRHQRGGRANSTASVIAVSARSD